MQQEFGVRLAGLSREVRQAGFFMRIFFRMKGRAGNNQR